MTRLWLRSLVLVLGLAGSSCTCGRSESSAAEEQLGYDPAAFASPRERPRAASSLLDAGAQPRERLRYGPRASDRSVQFEVFMSTWGEDAPMLTLELDWTGLEPEGETRRSLFEVRDARIAAPEADDEFEAAVQRRLVSMFERVAGQAQADASGLDRVAQTRGIPTQPSLEWLLTNAGVPLPEGPIGVGAVWTTARHWDEDVAGFETTPGDRETDPPEHAPIVETHSFTELRRYELIERDGPRLVVEVEASVTPDDPTRATSSRATGTLHLDLGDPLAQSGELEQHTRVVIPGFGDDQHERPELRTRVRTSSP